VIGLLSGDDVPRMAQTVHWRPTTMTEPTYNGGKEPLNGQVIPLRGGGSASGSGGPEPVQRPGCRYCADELVRQDDGRTFHLDGTPACKKRVDAYARKPVGWQPPR
jgi:hypothetical protein